MSSTGRPLQLWTENWKSTRWITEAVHIRKEGRQSLNRDDGSYTISHTNDQFLATSHLYRGKNRKKLLLMKISGTDRNVKVKNARLC